MQKTFNGVTTTYTLEGSNVVKETNGTDTFWYYYDASGSVISFEYNGTPYFYVKNLQGDIIGIIDSAGTQVVSYFYDAWGSIVRTYGTMASTLGTVNPYRYRGYRYDAETGFYYLNSRYYDPTVKRFINADGYVSTGQGVLGNNIFAYCGNNPVNRVDPTGQFWKELWDEFTQTIQQASGYFAVAAGVSLVDTPAPGPADVVSGVLLLGGVLVCAGIATYTAITAPAPSISIPMAEEKAEAIPTTPPTSTIIYRYYSSKNENLSPRPGRDYDGLSFSTEPPRPGVSAVVTTIEQVNATGILTAIPTGGTHVIVIPTNGTVNQWMSQGQSSIWSQTLSLIVLEWDGGS